PAAMHRQNPRIFSWITVGIAMHAHDLDSKPVLSLDMAKKMADACEAKAKAEGWNLNIAIVDAGADLLLFRRMPNAFLGSVDIAIGKAKTSSHFPFPTRMIANIAYGEDGKGGRVPGIAHVDGVIAFAGGLPIKAGDALIGAIGTSGATADQDEQCAQAGIDAIADMLK
ncbi:GlcG/HbpS family heme-binding protein, partial [Candidatus Entotheonella palauensis]|uniref:GlcG/HbpS family heme-binding protein n=1 Tax=Candidatus Entotheonella palauensis TaxID=93172 RepID=UPI000B7FBA57